mmetsp:Transcript_47680/g.132695  ORF Transcript_47680/g.132695 Transcript_47680/m.132695 type:complete len:215 (-) Transcript_47680:127-771(-)
MPRNASHQFGHEVRLQVPPPSQEPACIDKEGLVRAAVLGQDEQVHLPTARLLQPLRHLLDITRHPREVAEEVVAARGIQQLQQRARCIERASTAISTSHARCFKRGPGLPIGRRCRVGDRQSAGDQTLEMLDEHGAKLSLRVHEVCERTAHLWVALKLGHESCLGVLTDKGLHLQRLLEEGDTIQQTLLLAVCPTRSTDGENGEAQEVPVASST